MSLVTDLGYVFKKANPAQRAMQALASSRPGAWLFAQVMHHLDDAVAKVTRGRHSVPGLLAGLPVIDVTTTGRKSGQRRTTHLISIPIADTLALIGTNFGQTSTPGWVYNLEADPHASVTYRNVSRDVVARPATDEEFAEVMANSTSIYSGYKKYRQRITGRTIRIFVLDPV